MSDQTTLSEAASPASAPDGGKGLGAATGSAPAFPTPDTYYPNGQVQYGQPGLTIRDYLAAHAPITADAGDTWDEHAKLRYEYADAMLRAQSASADGREE